MFYKISILTAFIGLVLFLLLLGVPATYLATYGVETDGGGLLMVRRASPMFLGFAVMLWMGRNAGPSPLRHAVCYGMAVTFAGVALTGTFEYLRGATNAMIMAAAAGELLIAALFMKATRN